MSSKQDNKPILLKTKQQIYSGLTEKFHPGCLLHVKMVRNEHVPSLNGKYKSWFIGAGVSCIAYEHLSRHVPQINTWFPIKPTHIVYVLYGPEIVALFYNLDHKQKTGIFVDARLRKEGLRGKSKWKHWIVGWEEMVTATNKNKKFRIPEPFPGFLLGLDPESTS